MLLKNGMIFTEDGRFLPGDLLIKDGKIAAVGMIDEKDDEILDLGGKKVLPGLIDIHTHGCGMKDFCDGDAAAFDTLAATYIKNGVTTVCPASMTLPIERLERIYTSYNEWMKSDHPGSRLIGIHMEGPFLSEPKRGAHRAEYLCPADIGTFHRLQKASGDRIRLVSVAPEVEGNLAFIQQAAKEVSVSIAHTNGSYEEVMAGYKAGAVSTTHLYNGMSGMTHRAPGAVGAAFDSDAFAELICDGEHVVPAVLRTAIKLLGRERLVVVSDSLMAAGMPEGTKAMIGDDEVIVKGGKATLSNGTIAGSIVNLLEEIRRLIRYGVDEATAILGCTRNPAKVIGAYDRIGSIAVGKLADILVLEEDYTPYLVLRDGIRQII